MSRYGLAHDVSLKYLLIILTITPPRLAMSKKCRRVQLRSESMQAQAEGIRSDVQASTLAGYLQRDCLKLFVPSLPSLSTFKASTSL